MKPNLFLTDALFIHRHLLITYRTSGRVLSPGVIQMSELAKAYSGKRIQTNKIHIIQYEKDWTEMFPGCYGSSFGERGEILKKMDTDTGLMRGSD